MKEEVIQAAALYKAALKENQAELLIPLDTCQICYVPNMPRSHRSIWTEANLILFYTNPNPSEEVFDDYLTVSDLPSGTRRGLYFRVIDGIYMETADSPIDYHITKMACDNLRLSFSRSYCPTYVEIEPQLLLRLIKLLAFC